MEGMDYDVLWKREFLPLLKVSMVNRFLFELIGNRGYQFLVERMSRTTDVRRLMRRQYQPSAGKSFLYPFAALAARYRIHFKDYSCSHENCDCVWCRCQKE